MGTKIQIKRKDEEIILHSREGNKGGKAQREGTDEGGGEERGRVEVVVLGEVLLRSHKEKNNLQNLAESVAEGVEEDVGRGVELENDVEQDHDVAEEHQHVQASSKGL